MEALAALLIRTTKNEDTPGKAPLTAKSGELSVFSFHGKLASHLIKSFPSEVPAVQQDLVKRAKQCIGSQHEWSFGTVVACLNPPEPTLL